MISLLYLDESFSFKNMKDVSPVRFALKSIDKFTSIGVKGNEL